MSRMENLEAQIWARKSAEGGMTPGDLYMQGGKLAALFCIGFAFLAPCLLFWAYVL